LTPYIAFGSDNTIAIRLDNPPESSRWYPGGGVYRNVWLVKTAPVHVGHWGTYVTTPEATADAGAVAAKVTIENHSASTAKVKIKTQIFQRGSDGHKIGAAVASSEPIDLSVSANANATSDLSLRIDHPKLWSPREPNLYLAVTTVVANGKLVD